ncbi:hypothetical protein ZWY2020_009114 [Hordeum vulgare]|nr:hypothetical protein ZWY2020_009114 [Hordeum vulgare]
MNNTEGRSGTWRCATWRRAEAAQRALAAAAGPLVVALASAALILGDIGRASAFVDATPWKLQADELATVRLFKDNTPSVIYITNLVVHMADCLGCVALDDGVLHKVEAAAYWTAVMPNVEEYGSVVARAITSGDENVAKGIRWRGVMTVDMLPWGTRADSKNILITGGTRFVGLFLSRKLVQEGHQVTLFTRGKAPITQQLPGESYAEYAEFSSKVLHLKGDRKDFDFVKTSLSAKGFNVVYDINGREATEVSPILEAFIYCSSAGVYLKSYLLPHFESLLETSGVNWTSIRPVYIYGPLNYNPVEEWFFHRLKAGRPIPIPNAGNQITQLGHVKDLATAFIKVLGNPKASKQVYNISDSKYVTFDGIARACAKAGGFPEPEIIHYNPKDFNFGKKKAFPFRDQASKDLGVTPEYDLLDGLTDSYNLDFDRGTFRKEADFTTDNMILGKKLVSV